MHMEIKCNCGHSFIGVSLFELQKSGHGISPDVNVVSSKRKGDKWIFRCPKCKGENEK